MTFETSVEVVAPGAPIADNLRRLADGRLGALHIENFWNHAECDDAVRRISFELFEEYSPRHYQSQAFRIGPSLNEHRLSGKVTSHYWEAVDTGWKLWHSGMPEVRLHEDFLRAMRQAWEGAVRPATSEGRSTYWGIIRRMNAGTLVHWDDIRTEFPTPIFDDPLLGQISVNVFLKAPEEGGWLSVWSTAREPAHEQARTGYGYQRERVVPEEPEVRIWPRLGDAVFFSPCNYHAVDPVIHGDRVAFSLFLGIAAGGDLLLWA